MEHFDKFIDQLLDSYESTLAIEGKEICKEIDSILPDDFDLIREKARGYCNLCTGMEKDEFDTLLKEKCKKYLKHLRFYDELKSFLRSRNKLRK